MKSITSFSLDVKLKEKFYSKVSSKNRTKTIEILLSNYLKNKEKIANSSIGQTSTKLQQGEIG